MNGERLRARQRRAIGCFTLAVILIATAPVTLMGAAVFLDSRRSVLSRAVSPDGSRVAQVERLIVGGWPHIVVTLRRRWQPDWYLTSCKATSHYGDAQIRLRWSGNRLLVVDGPPSHWDSSAPFRWGGPLKAPPGCAPVVVLIPATRA